MTPESIVKAADVLFRLRLDPTFRLDHLAPDCVPADEAEGYQINDALHRKLSAAGYGDPAGYKLGCTTPLMQERIGLDHPAAGVIVNTCIFNHEVTHDGRVVRSMGIENEIVVRLGKDMPAGMAPWDGQKVAAYVDSVIGSIELVEQRYAIQEETRNAHIPTVIGDDFWHYGTILGEPVARWKDIDLLNSEAKTILDGKEIGSGFGKAALGDPLNAVAWCANHLAERGRELKAGMIVQTGNLVPVIRPVIGQTVVCDHGALGRATYRVI